MWPGSRTSQVSPLKEHHFGLARAAHHTYLDHPGDDPMRPGALRRGNVPGALSLRVEAALRQEKVWRAHGGDYAGPQQPPAWLSRFRRSAASSGVKAGARWAGGRALAKHDWAGRTLSGIAGGLD
jgi:hypothetical protein